ncbi:MAG: response regulator [Pseudomonadota bacterium]|nr:response regulator [Pseudomonadota bacterium]MDE3037668.1 response regulator [Pseudomonadota bacterium]
MDAIRPTDNFFIRYATTIAITAVTLLMLLASVMFWRQGEANEEAKSWVSHTYEVIGHIELLIGELRDAELGMRGFIITGDDDVLQPYEEALRDTSNPNETIRSLEQHRSIVQEIAFIKKLTADNPVEQSNLEEMQSVVAPLLDYMAAIIQEKRNSLAKNTMPKFDIQHGKEMMDHIRSLVRIMEAEENHLLALRSEVAESNTQQSNRLMIIAMIVFYVAMVLSIWLYQRSRARAAMQMLRYTQELERNEEELKMQQEELKASNEEIEASNEEMEEKNKTLEEQNAQIRQQAEELEESQRLIEEKVKEVERASKYKSEFLANMSHELRTPLNSLLILAKLLATNEGGNLTDEQMEEARVIHNGGLELLGLINDILDLSKVEAGKLTIAAEDITLDGMVKRMQQQFSPVAKEKNVAFRTNVSAGLPVTLHTDAQRVDQILKNLLSNAFKFTEQGSVTLEARRPEPIEIQRSSLDYENAIAFSVIDTGIGIEPSKFKDIFEAFQQEDGSIDRHYGGTGLGLTIARKFAHMLGGEIHVRSEKGKGSRFTLVLPVRLACAEMEETPNDAPESARIALKTMPRTSVAEFIADDRKNISDKDKALLIIEDDKNFAVTLMNIARKRGYKCLVAGDGKTGLVLAAEQKVDAIILDLKLPDIDGMNVLDQLKHDLRTRHIPVHIITGCEEGNVMPLRKGAIGYLTKPVEKEAIDRALTRIERLLQSEVKQVLVVEDDTKNQIAIQALLKKKDIHITIAGTGTVALQNIGNTKFDCIILDLQLPDMTGFEWLEKIEREAVTLPPVIVYTARELTEEENRKLERYTGSIIIKGAKSPERLLDEVTLFLHSVESTLSSDQQEIIRMQHNPDKVLQGKTVLLVDDDLRNTFALSKLIKKHGMNIVIADNGQMALNKLKEDTSIELIIMDIMMPVMDGYQAIYEIRAQKSLKSIPIIALTARAMPEEQEKCMAAGANDYLVKPVDIERLLTLLRVWLFKQELAA